MMDNQALATQSSSGPVSSEEAGVSPDKKASSEAAASKAVEMIYADSESFSSLIELMKASKENPANGIAQAAVMIIGKLEENSGELEEEALSAAGVAVVISLLDLANKAGIIPEITDEIAANAWGKALDVFIKKYPGRVDMNHIQELASQAGVAPQGRQAEMQAPEQESGLLG